MSYNKIPRGLSLRIIDNNTIQVTFENGIVKNCNIKDIVKNNKIFDPLWKDETLFYSAKMDIGGHGISWTDEIDIAIEGLWDNGSEI